MSALPTNATLAELMGVDLKDAKYALDMMEVDLQVAKKELIGIKKVLTVAKMDLEEADAPGPSPAPILTGEEGPASYRRRQR
ncbi:MAG: hypothetical protein Alis3KO_41430 [Aliiglaciecola sp.]